MCSERKRSSPQNNAGQGDRERQIERKREVSKGDRESCEESGDHENEPNVVGLPDRAHCFGNRSTLVA
jgi:hypothetical protein